MLMLYNTVAAPLPQLISQIQEQDNVHVYIQNTHTHKLCCHSSPSIIPFIVYGVYLFLTFLFHNNKDKRCL